MRLVFVEQATKAEGKAEQKGKNILENVAL
jgi:hypothetical protein